MAKELNTGEGKKRFKFLSFRENVDSIKLNVGLKSLLHRLDEPDDQESHFILTFRRWHLLNRTCHYTTFERQVKGYCQTISLQLYHKNQILDALLENLSVDKSMALQPLLELLVALVQDLQEELYADFDRICTCLIRLVADSQEASVYEWTFSAISHLFKYLSALLGQDIIHVYDTFHPLLADKRSYVRGFMAEAFAFLLRKCRGPCLTSILDHMVLTIRCSENAHAYYQQGVAQLVFETIRSVHQNLHSRAMLVLDRLYTLTLDAEIPFYEDSMVSLLELLHVQMYEHTAREHLAEPLNLLLSLLKSRTEPDPFWMAKCFVVLCPCLAVNRGKEIPDRAAIFQFLDYAGHLIASDWSMALDQYVVCVAAILIASSELEVNLHGRNLLSRVFAIILPDKVITLCRLLIQQSKWDAFDSSVLPLLVKYLNTHWWSSSDLFIAFVACMIHRGKSQALKVQLQKLSNSAENVNIIAGLYAIVQRDPTHISFTCRDEETLWTCGTLATRCLACLSDSSSAVNALSHHLRGLLDMLSSKAENEIVLNGLAYDLESIKCICKPETRDALIPIWKETVNKALPSIQLHAAALSSLVQFGTALKSYGATIFGLSNLLAALDSLLPFLKHESHYNRLRASAKVGCDVLLKSVESTHRRVLTSGNEQEEPQIKQTQQRPHDDEVEWTIYDEYWTTFKQLVDESASVAADPSSELEGLLTDATSKICRFVDTRTYYKWLLKTLVELSTTIEHKSEQFVPLFLELVRNEDGSAEPETDTTPATYSRIPKRVRNELISEYCNVFAKFRHPENAYKSQQVYQACLELLTNGDPKLQRVALDCIAAWRQPAIIKYLAALREMTDDSKFRDTMTNWNADEMNTFSDRSSAAVVLNRILYGKLVARSGKSFSKMRSHRAAIFTFIANLPQDDIVAFFHLMSEYFESDEVEVGRDDNSNNRVRSEKDTYVVRSGGFLALLEDFIRILGTRIIAVLPSMLNIIIKMAAMKDNEPRVKTLRQQAICRLSQLFRCHFDFDYDAFMPHIYKAVIEPRIPTFHVDLCYGPSAVMDLCISWSQNRQYAPYLVESSPDLVPRIFMLLAATNVKETVVSSVLDMVVNLQMLDEETMLVDDGLGQHRDFVDFIVLPHASLFLTNLSMIVERILEDSSGGQCGLKLTSNSLVSRIISSLAQLSPRLKSPVEGRKLVDILIPFLRKSDKAVPEDRKLDILRVVHSYLPILFEHGIKSNRTAYEALSRLFYQLSHRSSLEQLCRVFEELATVDPLLTPIVGVLTDLNSWSTRVLDEPDFGRKFNALQRITERQVMDNLETIHWIPILHNLLKSVEDPDEFSVRSAAEHAIVSFIEHATAATDDTIANTEMEKLVMQIIYSGIRRGVNNPLEFVRHTMTSLLGVVVKTMKHQSVFSDLVILLAAGDEEADFFHNVFHLQLHRRIRALRRLAGNCQNIRSSTLSEIFIPLLFQYVYNEKEKYDPSLVQEAMVCVGGLAKMLKWGPYYALVRRCLNLIKSKPKYETVFIRTVVKILGSFHFDLKDVVANEGPSVTSTKKVVTHKDGDMVMASCEGKDADATIADGDGSGQDDNNVALDQSGDHEVEEVADDVEAIEEVKSIADHKQLLKRIHETVMKSLLPELEGLLTSQDKKEYTNLRVPVAVGIASLTLFLPVPSRELKIHRLLVRLSALLRSRVNDLRDQVRDALNKIILLIGTTYLPALFTHLKDALTYGYQLHVLGYTVHSILMAVQPTLQPEALNLCIGQLSRVLINDIFGTTAEEREAEEYKGKMRETKDTKSFHSFEIVTQNMGPSVLDQLLAPIKELLLEISSITMKNKIVEILKRVSGGMTINPAFTPVALMTLLKSLIEENLRLTDAAGSSHKRLVGVVDPFAGKDMDEAIQRLSENSHVLVEFGLNLLLAGTRRQTIKLSDANQLALMDELVPVLAKCTYSENTEITALSIRILSLLSQHPPPKLQSMLPVIVKRVFEVIIKVSSTEADIVQNSLRFLTTIIREFPSVNISQNQLVALLALIKVDIENTQRQSTGFALARAILARKIVAKEVFDLMDIIASTLVTSQSSQTRALARMVYLAFLLDYPSGPKRLQRSIVSLVNNVKYEHESGRESVLEMLHGLIMKMSDEHILEFGETFFLALVVMMVNDTSSKCRRMAGELIKALFMRIVGKLDSDRVARLVKLWLQGKDNEQLQRTAIQAYGLLIEAVKEKARRWLPDVLSAIEEFLSVVAHKNSIAGDMEDDEAPIPWNHTYYPLNTLSKAFEVFPDIGYANANLWCMAVGKLLLYPHQWVRSLSSRLLGSLFSQVDSTLTIAKTSVKHPYLSQPGNIQELSLALISQLYSGAITAEMGHQAVKNLVFIAKHLDATTDTTEPEDKAEWNLAELCRRVCVLTTAARQHKQYVTVDCTYKWFAAVSTFLAPERLHALLKPIISTLYRAVNDEALERESAELKTLGAEVLDLLQKRVGSSAYLQVFNVVYEEIAGIRRERKTKRKIEAVTNPALHVRKKQHKHENSREAKKRKIESQRKQAGKYKKPAKPRIES
ncbi:hypothetical protein SeLEV6574_g00826 [Synchytrium endobioticum]|uniref:Uncharacterized protein n=1 Tax=Synchytrium endobioticum TaxID=286115 RepID=A0A507DFT0_9FUNG|nr:hypothetical protein SeLEV6574_g00826 [Synchytrium endobioticum]